MYYDEKQLERDISFIARICGTRTQRGFFTSTSFNIKGLEYDSLLNDSWNNNNIKTIVLQFNNERITQPLSMNDPAAWTIFKLKYT